jgi:hypothetical protein
MPRAVPGEDGNPEGFSTKDGKLITNYFYTYHTMVIPLKLQAIPQPSLETCFGHSPCFYSPDIITKIYMYLSK